MFAVASFFNKDASFSVVAQVAGSSGSRVMSAMISRSCGERTDSRPFGGKSTPGGSKEDKESGVDEWVIGRLA